MQAVIKTGGKQYIVSKGDTLNIEKLDGEPGSAVVFNEVLLIHGDHHQTQIGTPFINGAEVTGKIVRQKKAKKIVIFKYKRRKGYHKKQGHRQLQSVVEIQDIKGA